MQSTKFYSKREEKANYLTHGLACHIVAAWLIPF
jgi:hypothetical protein